MKYEMSGAHALRAIGTSLPTQSGSDSKTKPPAFHVRMSEDVRIGPDGELDYPDEILQGFDLVIASIHYAMDQEADRVTRRLLLAIEHPRVNIIGHPTGRRIGVGFPYDFDFDAVCQAASRHQVALEVNAHPDRLDLPDDHVRRAKEYGVRFTISTGARAPADLANMRYGVGTAQRGWATPEDVINTWPLEKLKRFLENGTT